MADNKISTISKIYAQALMDIASENSSEERFKIQLEEILNVLNSSEDLNVVLENSSISISKKLEILDSIFSNKIDKKVLNFLKLLIEKHRFKELNAIYYAYTDILDKKSNKKKVEIVSAINLNFEAKTNILFKLEHKLNCEIMPCWRVDENLIAGLTFKFDDYVIDTSISNKIENMSKTISR
ncbi:ATP synthase F1 subunit delta [bacterium]|nr:ATP synthase F1 subunit delta [bacterium]